MNKIINKFLWNEEIFMPRLHLKQLGLLTVLVDYFVNILKELKNSEKYIKHLYRNELDKSYFAHDAAYPNSKDLANFW